MRLTDILLDIKEKKPRHVTVTWRGVYSDLHPTRRRYWVKIRYEYSGEEHVVNIPVAGPVAADTAPLPRGYKCTEAFRAVGVVIYDCTWEGEE